MKRVARTERLNEGARLVQLKRAPLNRAYRIALPIPSPSAQINRLSRI